MWWLVGLAALITAGVVAAYAIGFVHGREVERGQWSAQARANRVLSGPRSLR